MLRQGAQFVNLSGLLRPNSVKHPGIVERESCRPQNGGIVIVQGLGFPVTKWVGVIAGQQVPRRPVILPGEYGRCKTRPRSRQAHDNCVSEEFHTNSSAATSESSRRPRTDFLPGNCWL